jgi:hypothetical protein
MRYVVHSLGQFLFKVSVSYLRAGYVHYAIGVIPEHKDPEVVDRKLLAKYGITSCRMTRLRQRRQGQSSVMYLRLQRRFIILATDGQHLFFDEEQHHDCRQRPILFSGYSLGIKGGKPWVAIAPQRWIAICREAERMTLHNEIKITDYLHNISPLTFQGINEQRLKLVRAINRKRRAARLPAIHF